MAYGMIYKLESGSGPCYVGSTCQKLSTRLRGHKSDFKRWQEGKESKSVTSFELFKRGPVEITLIENVHSLDELRARERYWIERLDCVNKNIPGRTYREYIRDHPEIRRKEKKRYKAAHRSKINANKVEKISCPHCGKAISRINMAQHKKRMHCATANEA